MSGKRVAIVDQAMTWLKTPWHHQGRVKGAGVDCAYFLVEVFADAGLIPRIDLGEYPPDWHIHRDEPRFLNVLKNYADLTEQDPLPGDIAMFRFGRTASHGSIVVEWPLIIHAYKDERMVTISDASRGPLADRLDGIYRLRGLA
ncbi:hypothetical protein SAMN05216428_1144 [Nitrosospira sp. Nsp11]|uniref:C40 family peptidase n=1 Tax=Nitrosospira sp. Nsp11 TaxID=1855338 RepID=UPI00091388F8|nr:NlpC/P60 family protein [Nitrosospira sp. Nsp11]SHM10687.1 hypothetical protein SAMN05216428_1144 [Nitrosospira sp. Nsp11]